MKKARSPRRPQSRRTKRPRLPQPTLPPKSSTRRTSLPRPPTLTRAISTLDAQIAAFGGFIERSDVNGDTRYNNDGTTSIINRWAYYTIRVPASRFEEFLHQTEGIGNVTSVSRYAENVTSQYTDYEARLDSLRTQEERLLAMLEKSEDVESLIALEQRLADVRYELESIERNLRNLDLQISYSTINLNLQEVEVYTPTVPVQRTFGEKLSDAFSDGWTGFVRGLQYFCLGLASSLPGLVLFVLIVLALFFLVRSILRKVKSGRKAKQEASQQPPEQDSKSEISGQKPGTLCVPVFLCRIGF